MTENTTALQDEFNVLVNKIHNDLADNGIYTLGLGEDSSIVKYGVGSSKIAISNAVAMCTWWEDNLKDVGINQCPAQVFINDVIEDKLNAKNRIIYSLALLIADDILSLK